MRVSKIGSARCQNMGTIIAFYESTLEEQRAYVWKYIAHKTCLYVDWNGDISRYNRPPSMPYTLHISEQNHVCVMNMITQLCSTLDVHILVFDPFTSIRKQSLAPLFSSISHLVHVQNITVFFMLALQQAPLIQAEVYIDPRR